MLTEVIDALTATISRRGFVGKTIAASAALIIGVLGLDKLAMAGNPGPNETACCSLCHPTSSCTGSYTGSWCWTCPYPQGIHCRIWQCLEYFNAGGQSNCFSSNCAERGWPGICGCDDVACSTAKMTTQTCL